MRHWLSWCSEARQNVPEEKSCGPRKTRLLERISPPPSFINIGKIIILAITFLLFLRVPLSGVRTSINRLKGWQTRWSWFRKTASTNFYIHPSCVFLNLLIEPSRLAAQSISNFKFVLTFHSTYKFSLISSYTFLAFRTLLKGISSFHALLWAHRYLAPYQHLVTVVRNNAHLWDRFVMSVHYYWQFHDIFHVSKHIKRFLAKFCVQVCSRGDYGTHSDRNNTCCFLQDMGRWISWMKCCLWSMFLCKIQ
jgi:hypothetical protein